MSADVLELLVCLSLGSIALWLFIWTCRDRGLPPEPEAAPPQPQRVRPVVKRNPDNETTMNLSPVSRVRPFMLTPEERPPRCNS